MSIVDAQTETHLRALPLDGVSLGMTPEEEAFLKSETGIQDTEELKKHIIEVRKDAYKVSRCSRTDRTKSTPGSNIVFRVQVYPYPCILGFGFAKIRITELLAYPRVLELGKSRPDAIFMDIGCCSEHQLILGICLNLTCGFAPGQWVLR